MSHYACLACSITSHLGLQLLSVIRYAANLGYVSVRILKVNSFDYEMLPSCAPCYAEPNVVTRRFLHCTLDGRNGRVGVKRDAEKFCVCIKLTLK